MSAKELNVQSDSAVACDMQQANSACVTRYKGAASTHGHRSQQDKHANSVLYSVSTSTMESGHHTHPLLAVLTHVQGLPVYQPLPCVLPPRFTIQPL